MFDDVATPPRRRRLSSSAGGQGWKLNTLPAACTDWTMRCGRSSTGRCTHRPSTLMKCYSRPFVDDPSANLTSMTTDQWRLDDHRPPDVIFFQFSKKVQISGLFHDNLQLIGASKCYQTTPKYAGLKRIALRYH